jgi:hypothetical protein
MFLEGRAKILPLGIKQQQQKKKSEVIIMSRIPVCMCKNCNAVGTVRVPIAKRGDRYGYMCERHARRLEGYAVENNFRMGVSKKDPWTCSCELEVSFASTKARGELIDFGFLPTSDCTVSAEFKSPIYEGLNALSKQCVSIEKLLESGDIRIGSECGTHFHIGHAEYINPITMRYLRRFNGSLFVPLSDAIMQNREKSARFFGRLPNSWSEPVTFSDPSGDFNGDYMKHSAMFNLQHDYTIEFRQAKFVNAKQYMAVAKFSRDCANAIIENFIKHFNDTDFDTRRYSNRTEYRKHKAQVTAQKLVKLYEKYTANI